MKKIVLADAISTTIVAGAWATSAGFAIAESSNPATGFGTCMASNDQQTPVDTMDKKQYIVELIKSFNVISDAFADKENAEKELKGLGLGWLAGLFMAAGV
ncbi:MAG: hypothetical protein AABY86_13750, partial [Bdellovibrionota bacterium]